MDSGLYVANSYNNPRLHQALLILTSSDYVPSQPKSVSQHDHILHEISPTDLKSPSAFSLETHGFAAVKHRSILSSPPYTAKSFFSPETISEVYIPELVSLIKSITGAKEVRIIATSWRAAAVIQPTPEMKVQAVANVSQWDMKTPMMTGLASFQTPVRDVHIDYSAESARAMLRNFTPDVWEAAKDIIDAEDEAVASGTEYNGRRYAFFSVWRPLKTVQKDPLAVCDPSTIDRDRDLVDLPFKRPSLKGDYIAGGAVVRRDRAQSQKWYWMKEQKEDEVWILQFFDNFAEREGRPIGVPHCSPELLGVEGGETRESIETRVIALW
jgi:GA4 desaturase